MSLVFATTFFFYWGGGGGVLRHSAVQTDFEFEISGPLVQIIGQHRNNAILDAILENTAHELLKGHFRARHPHGTTGVNPSPRKGVATHSTVLQ